MIPLKGYSAFLCGRSTELFKGSIHNFNQIWSIKEKLVCVSRSLLDPHNVFFSKQTSLDLNKIAVLKKTKHLFIVCAVIMSAHTLYGPSWLKYQILSLSDRSWPQHLQGKLLQPCYIKNGESLNFYQIVNSPFRIVYIYFLMVATSENTRNTEAKSPYFDRTNNCFIYSWIWAYLPYSNI